jgi:DUF4097 and DUF4098 domain-containing protein YvlB
MLFAFALLTTALAPQGTDTTVPVRGATRLEVSSTEGEITVQTWNRSSVRIVADHDDDTRIEVDQSGRTIRLRGRARYGPSEVSWRLTVPTDLALDLSSQSGDVRVSGTKGEVAVSTVEGNITVEGGGGFISLQSVEGDVTLSGTAGRIKVTTVDGKIDVRRADGDIKANAVDGDILLDDIESSGVEATTVDGDIAYNGAIRVGGRYSLSSHDGDVTLTAPSISAEVTVSTFSGDFESDYPVTLSGTQNRGRMNFTLGSGGAHLDLESFDGTVSLRKGSGARKP